jgi:plasmid stabilization system protein ParE
MVKTIVWTKRANSKFSSIIRYLESEWSHAAVKSFVQRTYNVIELLAEHPHIGTIENQEKEIRGFLITKHNRVFYRETTNEVILLNFFDTRSKPKSKRNK